MQRRALVAFCVATFLGVTPAIGQTVSERYVAQLKAQGFSEIVVTRTWLGRTRITASSKSKVREIIISSRSGEVLRDYWEDSDAGSGLLSELLDLGSDDTGSTGDAGSSGQGSAGSGAGSGGGGADFNYLTGGAAGDIEFAPNNDQRGSRD